MQSFLKKNDLLVARTQPRAVDLSELADEVRGLRGIVVGSGREPVEDMSAGGLRALSGLEEICPFVVASMATERDPDGLPPRPFYLRKPDAKLPRPKVSIA